MSQAYYTEFTVQSGQVTGTQTNFPMLIIPTDNRFKTIGNGGHVANSNGYDIRPYSDAGLTTALSYELVPGTYDASAGTFEMWVNVASLAVGSIVYLGYGDVSLTTDGSSTAAWDSSFKAVYHLPNGSSLTTNDSTSNANNLTNVNTVTATTGKIDGGALFTSGSSNRLLNNTTTGLPSGTQPFTLEGWFKMGANQTEEIFGFGNNVFGATGQRVAFYWQNDGKLYVDCTNCDRNFSWTYDTNLHYAVVTLPSGTNSTDLVMYLDGALQTSASSASGTLNISTQEIRLSGIPNFVGGGFWFTGVLDEVRISSGARTTNWISACYNNQSAPGTFYSIGTEQVVSSPSAGSVSLDLSLSGVGSSKVSSAGSSALAISVSGVGVGSSSSIGSVSVDIGVSATGIIYHFGDGSISISIGIYAPGSHVVYGAGSIDMDITILGAMVDASIRYLPVYTIMRNSVTPAEGSMSDEIVACEGAFY